MPGHTATSHGRFNLISPAIASLPVRSRRTGPDHVAAPRAPSRIPPDSLTARRTKVTHPASYSSNRRNTCAYRCPETAEWARPDHSIDAANGADGIIYAINPGFGREVRRPI